jgi:hypothetical protein
VRRVKFWEQFLLQLVSPVAGTALIGGAAAVLARRYQDRRLDRQIRMDLVSRVSEVVCAIHTMLSFYERWVRHSRPAPEDREVRRADVDRDFIGQRSKLSVLQTETDAYFGQASEPGILLHRLADLTMLRYAIILALPGSQVTEMIDHLGRPGHSGFSVAQLGEFLATPQPSGTQIWAPTATIEEAFMKGLHDTVRAILSTRPVRAAEGFVSSKLLTAYDQGDSVTDEREREQSAT